MGVIQRQSIKNSLVNYFATGLGFIATIFVYPYDLEAKGLIDFLMNLGVLFTPYAQIGLFPVYFKFFPRFLDKIGSFQKWILTRLLIQFSIFSLLYYILRNPLSHFLSYSGIDKSGNFEAYSPFIPLMIFCLIAQAFLVMISETNQRIVVTDIIRNIIQKIYFPFIIILKFSLDLSTSIFISLFFLYYAITIPLLLWYVISNGFFKIKRNNSIIFTKDEKKEIRAFNGYSLLNDISTQLSFKLDSVMVASLINLTQTGIYGIMFYMSNVLSTGSSSILKISNPIVSEEMAKNNISAVSELYKKSSLTLLIFGLMVFYTIWFLIQDILSLTKYSEQLLVGKYVFLYLALSKIFDMATSINSYILIYSKYYRVNLIFVGVLGICNIFLNLLFIPKYGIEGAAIASLIAMVTYNTLKLLFILFKFKIHPFSKETLKVLAIACISFTVLFFIPEGKYFDSPFVNLTLKVILTTSIVCTTFLLPIYLLKVSKEINSLIDKTLNKLKIIKT